MKQKTCYISEKYLQFSFFPPGFKNNVIYMEVIIHIALPKLFSKVFHNPVGHLWERAATSSWISSLEIKLDEPTGHAILPHKETMSKWQAMRAMAQSYWNQESSE